VFNKYRTVLQKKKESKQQIKKGKLEKMSRKYATSRITLPALPVLGSDTCDFRYIGTHCRTKFWTDKSNKWQNIG
jgi:siroheme synthase